MIKQMVKMFPVLLLSVILACASVGRSYDMTPKTLVEVDNRGWLDANVYLYRNGTRIQRLGTVTGNSTQRLYISNRIVSGLPFQLYVRPIAGYDSYITDDLTVDSERQYIIFQIGDPLAHTSWAIFPLRGRDQ